MIALGIVEIYLHFLHFTYGKHHFRTAPCRD